MILIILLWLAGVFFFGAAYGANALWLFHHLSSAFTPETLVALVGILAVPLGVMHGIYLWF